MFAASKVVDDEKKADDDQEKFIRVERIPEVIQSDDGRGLNQHTFQDIGRFTVFPESHWKRMFPSESFGRIEEDTFKWNNTRGIMTREESLKLVHELGKLTLPSERNVDYGEIAHSFSNRQVKEEVLHDEHGFAAV